MRCLILSLLCFFLCVWPASADPHHRRVLIIGDSEACAVAPFAPAIAQSIHPGDIVEVACKSGTTVQHWGEQGHLASYLSQHPHPDAIVVFLGTNHVYDRTAPNVGPILDVIRADGAGCVWVGNTAVHGKKWPINGMLRAAVTPTCTYFDTEAAGVPLRDGVHPTHVGAVRWLQAIWPTISSEV